MGAAGEPIIRVQGMNQEMMDDDGMSQEDRSSSEMESDDSNLFY